MNLLPTKSNALDLKNILVFLVLIVAIYYRFYNIKDYVVFLGDEGRDMIVMREIFTDYNLPFIGPSASVGGFYLGPIYYWMAAPFLYLTKFDPVGPSYMVAIFGVATVYLIYKFLKESFGYWPAIYSSALYAVAPLIVRYSRSSWNPNPLPFFSLLLLYFVYLAIKKNNLKYYLAVGACFGVAIQLHYLALILAPLSTIIIIINEKIKRAPLVFFLCLIGFLITFSPFLVFEIKNSFPNFKTIWEFVTRGSTVGYSSNILWSIADSANIFLEWISQVKGTVYTRIFFWIITVVSFSGLVFYWRKPQKLVYSLAVFYFFGGLFFLRLYAGQLHDYYFGIIFPAPFILYGIFTAQLHAKSRTIWIASLVSIVLFATFITSDFYKETPNKQIKQAEQIANTISDLSEGKPYNFALIASGNSDHAYRYFLQNTHQPTKLESNVTEQLLVLCEDVPCAPLGYPTWEIAGFGRAEIDGEWNLPKFGFKVLRLKHHQTSLDLIGKPAVKGI